MSRETKTTDADSTGVQVDSGIIKARVWSQVRDFAAEPIMIRSMDDCTAMFANFLAYAEDEEYIEAQKCASRIESDSEFWSREHRFASWRPYEVDGGVLTIPIQGTLRHKFPYARSDSTGYEYIARATDRGLQDEEVSCIVFECNSPGGTSAGLFELCDALYAARGQKDMVAVADDYAFSAAYAVACTADSVCVSRSGGVGSVGVYSLHLDFSKLLDDFGIKPTFVKAGERKVDGNFMQPLSKRAKETMQKSVDKCYDEFVSLVATCRNMSYDAVKSTEAACFESDESLEIGFADEICEVRDVQLKYEKEAAKHERGITMSNLGLGKNKTESQNEPDSAAEAKQAERERWAGVKDLESYAANKSLADSLLSSTDMSVEEIDSQLQAASTDRQESEPDKSAETEVKKSAKRTSGNGNGNAFKEHMDKQESPNVGADDEDSSSEKSTQEQVNQMFLNEAAASGKLTSFDHRGRAVRLKKDREGNVHLDEDLVATSFSGEDQRYIQEDLN